MKRFLVASAMAMAVVGFFWAVPPVRFRSLKTLQDTRAKAQFSANAFAAVFWQDSLLNSLEHAADAETVLTCIATNRAEVKERFGRTVGLGGSYYLFIQGAGRVIATNEDKVDLAIRQATNETDITVPLGLVFGNALRDGTGLLSASTFPNSQDFNAIATELNAIAESQVLPELQKIARPGQRLHFAGCVEVEDEAADLKPLKLTPIAVRLE